MNKKVLIIIIIILALALVGETTYIILNGNSKCDNVVENKTSENEGTGSEGYEPTEEDTIYKELFKIFAAKYPETYDFGIAEDEVLRFTLNDLEKDGVNVAFFNSEKYTCDKDKTYVEILYMDGSVVRQGTLSCTIN